MNRGGKREGAGRPTISDSPKVKITVTLDRDIVEKIEGNKSSSINQILKDYFKADEE